MFVTVTALRHVTQWYDCNCRNPVGSHEYIFFIFLPYPFYIFPEAYRERSSSHDASDTHKDPLFFS